MPASNPQARAGDGKAAGLPRLDVSLAESEYREQRHNHRRQQSLQSPHTGPSISGGSPLPSPLSPAFSRDDRRPAGPPPPPYLASMPSSPAYSQASFAPLDPAQKQELLGGGGDARSPRQASPTYLSPYGGGGVASPGADGGGGGGYSNSTEWIPMQRPLPPLGAVAAAQSKRRRRLRMVVFCIAPLLLFILVGVLVVVLGVVRPGTSPA
ncbi:hypothetical protein RB595_010006 [Gaeumannomyces hyphopodioides]